MVQESLLSYTHAGMSVSGSGHSVSTLRSLGIDMNNDGTLTVDSTQLNFVLRVIQSPEKESDRMCATRIQSRQS